MEKALRLAPTDAKISYNLGLLYEQQDQEEKAVEVWEQAIKLKPNYRRVYFKLANTYISNNQPDKAKQKLLFILDNIDPDDEQAQQLLQKLE